MHLDKTDLLIEDFKATIDMELTGGYVLSHNRLLGELDHYIKMKAIKSCGSISSAAILLGLKRTTLAEYLRKLGVKVEDILSGNT